MSDVVNLQEFKAKKKQTEELARGRQPLFISHKDGKLYGSANKETNQDNLDRLTRIRTSLEKINRLMSELKKVRNETPTSKNIIKGEINATTRITRKAKQAKAEKR